MMRCASRTAPPKSATETFREKCAEAPSLSVMRLRSETRIGAISAGKRVFQPNHIGGSNPDGLAGGQGGIRTHDTVTRMPHFECGAFNRSATCPSVGII